MCSCPSLNSFWYSPSSLTSPSLPPPTAASAAFVNFGFPTSSGPIPCRSLGTSAIISRTFAPQGTFPLPNQISPLSAAALTCQTRSYFLLMFQSRAVAPAPWRSLSSAFQVFTPAINFGLLSAGFPHSNVPSKIAFVQVSFPLGIQSHLSGRVAAYRKFRWSPSDSWDAYFHSCNPRSHVQARWAWVLRPQCCCCAALLFPAQIRPDALLINLFVCSHWMIAHQPSVASDLTCRGS